MPHDLSRLGAWADLPFFSAQWPAIESALAQDPRQRLPPDPLRFAALERTQPQDTRVVILGQDPYPTPGHANGLAFSVTPDTPLPKSLKNIFQELAEDFGTAPDHGDLGHWADQGVLLLNTALSVPAGSSGGHADFGWQTLMTEVLGYLSGKPRAFLLWGKHAQGFRRDIVGDYHFFIETPHPSPLSAYRGFFGSHPFSRTNAWLQANAQKPIRWV
jgi:uracil-DNA glycosylase